jgi:hypothetical protein
MRESFQFSVNQDTCQFNTTFASSPIYRGIFFFTNEEEYAALSLIQFRARLDSTEFIGTRSFIVSPLHDRILRILKLCDVDYLEMFCECDPHSHVTTCDPALSFSSAWVEAGKRSAPSVESS